MPDGVAVEDPFEIVYAIDRPGVAQFGRTLVVGAPGSEFRVHEYDLAEDFAEYPEDQRQALHAGAFEMYLQDGARCRLAQVQDWGAGEVYDVSTRFVGVGRDAYCHWLPALLGGHLVRQHLELAVSEQGGEMAFRGMFFAEEHEHLDVFAVDLHETGPSDGDVHWRGIATGESRASFEGLIQIDPGAQQTHTYLQIHSMMLSPKARIDAIPSVLVSADDVSASHGGTVGELDEAVIFYMQSRGLDRPTAVRVIVEGFFEPLIAELADEPLQELVRGAAREQAGARARGHRDLCHQSLSASLGVREDFPIFRRRVRREAAGLPGLELDLAEARGRDRGARRRTCASTTPTSTAASTSWPRRPTRPSRAPASGSPPSPTPAPG